MKKNSRLFFLSGPLLCSCLFGRAQILSDTLALQQANLPHGITLNYISSGTGAPVDRIHGSLSDYTYWLDQAVSSENTFTSS